MLFDRLTDACDRAIGRHHDAAKIRQRVEQRVETPDMIEEQEINRTITPAGHAEFFEQHGKRMQVRFWLAGRTRTEQYQTRLAGGAYLSKQWMVIPKRRLHQTGICVVHYFH